MSFSRLCAEVEVRGGSVTICSDLMGEQAKLDAIDVWEGKAQHSDLLFHERLRGRSLDQAAERLMAKIRARKT